MERLAEAKALGQPFSGKGLMREYKRQKRKEAVARQALEKAEAAARAIENAKVGLETKKAMRVALKTLSPEMFDRKVKEWLDRGGDGDF